MKIGIMGTHGIGKTYMAINLAGFIKSMDSTRKIGILPKQTRSCPFPVNENMSEASQAWLFHTQIKAELEVMPIYDTLICDHTVMDFLAYAMWAELDDFAHRYMSLAMDWFKTYDQVIWLRPRVDDDFPENDGFRSESRLFQVGIDLKLDAMVIDYRLPVISNRNAAWLGIDLLKVLGF